MRGEQVVGLFAEVEPFGIGTQVGVRDESDDPMLGEKTHRKRIGVGSGDAGKGIGSVQFVMDDPVPFTAQFPQEGVEGFIRDSADSTEVSELEALIPLQSEQELLFWGQLLLWHTSSIDGVSAVSSDGSESSLSSYLAWCVAS